ncbi:MAG: DUF4296 domain-containing protein [Rikenellaceae bacterium]|nr:DUF4296 domain-containing protein [Rikenellaceae bacterium]MCL2693414.1 DUF4296 domain-containing protein [Rikenellaceae bacterium]
MKRIIYIALLLVAALGAGCSRAKNIPRSELAEIFKDAYLANAYRQQNPQIEFDSIDMYGPVLARYGYTVRDLEYTVERISRQKSRNLSDIVERAIAELKRESEWLTGRVAVLDTVDARVARMMMDTVLFERRIMATEIADTAHLKIVIPLREGAYVVNYISVTDTLEQNAGVRIVGQVLDTLGTRRHIFSQPVITGSRRRPNAPHRFETTPADSILILTLGNYPSQNMRRPHLTVDSLEVLFFFPPQAALDSLMRTLPYYPEYLR